jgi:hypothetical protein
MNEQQKGAFAYAIFEALLVDVCCPQSGHLLFRAFEGRPLHIEIRCRCKRLLLVKEAGDIDVLSDW